MSAFSREIDEKIDIYSNYLETVSPTERPHVQFMIHNAKLMKNKLTAMLAELDVLIAENNLKAAVEQLESFKKDYGKEAASKESPVPETAKTKTQKQPQKKAMSSTDTVKNDNAGQTTGNTDKENTKPASTNSKRNKTTQDNEIPDKGTKRHHSDSSRSSAHCKKKQKIMHTADVNSNKSTLSKNSDNSNNTTHSNNSSHTATLLRTNMNSKNSTHSKNSSHTANLHRTNINTKNSNKYKNSMHSNNSSHTASLLRTNMSPIKKTSCYITQGVQTCNWLEQVRPSLESCRRSNNQSVKDVPHRILDDDECTVIIEDLSVNAPNTHKDAINISKALRQIMSPGTELVKADKVTEDLTERPVLPSMKILFEDDLEKVSKKKLYRLKSESPETDLLNNSNKNLVNELFKDILEAKKHGSRPENCSYAVSSMGNICKNMLRDILKQC